MVRNSTRFVTTAKIPPDKLDERRHGLSFLILSAGRNRILDIPHPIMQVMSDKKLIDCQIDRIREHFPHSEIIIGLGFGADKVHQHLNSRIKAIENESWEKTNGARTLSLLTRVAANSTIVVIEGDVLFNTLSVYELNPGRSCVLAARNQIDKNKIGLVHTNQTVSDFSFGSELKWAKVAVLTGKELELTKEIIHCRDNDHLCMFEVLDIVAKRGGILHVVERNDLTFFEINCHADIKKSGRQNYD